MAERGEGGGQPWWKNVLGAAADAVTPGNIYQHNVGFDKQASITGLARLAGGHLGGPVGGIIAGGIANRAQGLPLSANFFRSYNPQGGVQRQDIPYGGGNTQVSDANFSGLQAGRPNIGPGGQVSYGPQMSQGGGQTGLQGFMSSNTPWSSYGGAPTTGGNYSPGYTPQIATGTPATNVGYAMLPSYGGPSAAPSAAPTASTGYASGSGGGGGWTGYGRGAKTGTRIRQV